MVKQSMFQVLDIGRHCICVQIRVFKHIACWIKKYSSETLNYFLFSAYRIAHRTILNKFGPTQCINSLRIAKRHQMTLKLYIHPGTILWTELYTIIQHRSHLLLNIYSRNNCCILVLSLLVLVLRRQKQLFPARIALFRQVHTKKKLQFLPGKIFSVDSAIWNHIIWKKPCMYYR